MKFTSLSAVGILLFVSTASAQDSLRSTTDSIEVVSPSFNRNNLRFVDFHAYGNHDSFSLPDYEVESQINPSHLDAYPISGLWKQGWFVGISAGGSAFVGNPIGCEDLFGRIKPAMQINLGKWIIPSFAIRFQYQGMELTNGQIADQEYHNVHADMMLDVASLFRSSRSSKKVSLIPFVGCGIMKNIDADANTFSLHYGLIGSLMLSRHFHLNLELSGLDTFRNFDGIGSSSTLGDQLFSASLGLSYTMGSAQGQNRVIDATPYIEQNERLLRQNRELTDNGRYLLSELSEKDKALKEYRKILEIKGWLSQSSDSSEAGIADKDAKTTIGYPYNNYSGLNSLLARLHDPTYNNDSRSPEKWQWKDNGHGDMLQDSINSKEKSDDEHKTDYLFRVKKNKTCIGSPILFFFHLNSTRLKDPSQYANLKEIASIAGKYNLMIRISGAADSATGNTDENQKLSKSRAEYISSELQKLGISSNRIHCEAKGGIDAYEPSAANRNTRVELFLQ